MSIRWMFTTQRRSIALRAFAFMLILVVTPDRFVLAEEHEHNRCLPRHFAQFSDWSEPVNLGPVVNSHFNDQHPAISRDGLSLYISSDRPGGFGDFDIYVSHRASVNDEWGPPQNLGPIINTEFEDSVPTFSADGHRMYFESGFPGGFGHNDIWVSFREDATDDFAWQTPTNLGSGVNTDKSEGGPTIFEDRHHGVTTLYFTRCLTEEPCGFGNPNEKWDIYASVMNEDGTFGTAVPVPELNSGYRDTRTAIRSDGLELFLTSSRPGGFGGIDLWVSTRVSTDDPWIEPKNLGPIINSTYKEGAPALSCDATTLYFYSDRPGGFGNNDLYVTTRHRLHHEDNDEATFTTIDPPGASSTTAHGINARGDIVGASVSAGVVHGYLLSRRGRHEDGDDQGF